MPGNETVIVRLFSKEAGPPNNDIRADQVFDRIDHV